MSRDVLLQKDFSEEIIFFVDDDDALKTPKTINMKIIIYLLALIIFSFACYLVIAKENYTAATFFMVTCICVLKLWDSQPRP